MHELDTALQAAYPVALAPCYGAFEAMSECGTRYLVSANGLWLEAKLSWLHALVPYAPLDPKLPTLPYGELQQGFTFTAGPLPLSLIRRFIAEATAHGTVEHAALISHSLQTGWQYRQPIVKSRSAGHIQYDYPEWDDTTSLAIDLHSHGKSAAFFSRQDNRDDASQIKLAITVGNCTGAVDEVSVVARLCLRGIYIDVTNNLIDTLTKAN